jgi:hypothetical protein
MKLSFHSNVIVVTVASWISSSLLWMAHAQTSSSTTPTSRSGTCVQEFDPCVMPRDCCKGLECIAGDWAQTTESTCLSRQSQQIASLRLTLGQQKALLKDFYVKQQVVKTDDESDDIIKHFRPFARLVSRLEQKYQQPFQIIPNSNDHETNDEL